MSLIPSLRLDLLSSARSSSLVASFHSFPSRFYRSDSSAGGSFIGGGRNFQGLGSPLFGRDAPLGGKSQGHQRDDSRASSFRIAGPPGRVFVPPRAAPPQVQAAPLAARTPVDERSRVRLSFHLVAIKGTLELISRVFVFVPFAFSFSQSPVPRAPSPNPRAPSPSYRAPSPNTNVNSNRGPSPAGSRPLPPNPATRPKVRFPKLFLLRFIRPIICI